MSLFESSSNEDIQRENDELVHHSMRLQRENHSRLRCPYHYYITKQLNSNGDFIVLGNGWKSQVLSVSANGVYLARLLSVRRYIQDTRATKGNYNLIIRLQTNKPLELVNKAITDKLQNDTLASLIALTENGFYKSPLELYEVLTHVQMELDSIKTKFEAYIDKQFIT